MYLCPKRVEQAVAGDLTCAGRRLRGQKIRGIAAFWSKKHVHGQDLLKMYQITTLTCFAFIVFNVALLAETPT